MYSFQQPADDAHCTIVRDITRNDTFRATRETRYNQDRPALGPWLITMLL